MDINEKSFQIWYKAISKEYGLDPNPDAPEHHYNYRGAFKEGIAPTYQPEHNQYRWPDTFKSNDYNDVIDHETGKPNMNAIPPKDLSQFGKGNDSIVAHISPREAAILKYLGGSGDVNPYTGLLQFDDGPGGGQGESDPGGVGSDTGGGGNAAAASDLDAFSTPNPSTPSEMATDLDSMSRDSRSFMEKISDSLQGITHGFTSTLAGLTVGTGAKAIATGVLGAINPLVGTAIAIGGGWLGGKIADNMEPPSQQGLDSISAMGANSDSSPNIDSSLVSIDNSSTPMGIPDNPLNKIRINNKLVQSNQSNALTGLPLQRRI